MPEAVITSAPSVKGAPLLWLLGVEETTPLTLDRAWAETEQSIIVVLSREPRAVDPGASGDALNPASWSVIPASGEAPLVLGVTARSPTIYRLWLSRSPADRYQTASVTATGLTAASDDVPLTPGVLVFFGLSAPTRPETDAQAAAGPRDIAGVVFGPAGGTWEMTPAGDYALSDPAATIRKMVFRVLTTARGAFAHAPDFGVSLPLKGLGAPERLQRFQADARVGILALPGVRDCWVSVSWVESSLVVRVKVSTLSGTQDITWRG